MLKQLRQNIMQNLWETYSKSSLDMQCIDIALKQKGLHRIILDHFAIIDLPGPNTGISHLREIFSSLGYIERGKDYLASKQNDFLWMAEINCDEFPIFEVLPQVVVADFRLEEMPTEISRIIQCYAKQAPPSPINEIRKLIQRIELGETAAITACTKLISNYFTGRDWALPTLNEFSTVREFNELLAWVLVFGRRPNHFTLSIHLLDYFKDLSDFHRFIETTVGLPLHQEGGVLKGGKSIGIAQGSTSGIPQTIQLMDGNIEIPTGFIEFVWRYPAHASQQHPKRWGDYFTGFIAQHAERVIESLYLEPLSQAPNHKSISSHTS